MTERGRFSVDDLKRIGWRLKAVRSLTGLNQEEFAAECDIPHMTIKGWEMGRVLARQDGIRRFLSGLESFGIQISPEWIFFGEGNGPMYRNEKNGDTKTDEQASHVSLLKAFRDDLRRIGSNPISTIVNDDSMKPRYHRGDLVGGILTPLREIIADYTEEQINTQCWLVPHIGSDWVVRNILLHDGRIFFKQANSSNIEASNTSMLGRVVLHYALGRHT